MTAAPNARGEIELDVAGWAGRWIEIAYETSLFDALERPAIVWRGASGEEERVFAPAPIFGAGLWTGIAPSFARTAVVTSIRGGGGRLRIVRAGPISLARVVARAASARPGLAALAARCWASGDRRRASRRLSAALAAWPLSAASDWAKRRRRPPEWDGLDRPAPGAGPRLQLLVAERNAEWLRALADPAGVVSIITCEAATPLLALIADLDDDDLVVVAPAGVALPAEAAAIWREAARSWPADLYYADEADGPDAAPRFKPDWSPILAESVDLFGVAFAARAAWVRSRFGEASVGDLAPRAVPGDQVVHVRRVLAYGAAARRGHAPAQEPAKAPALPALLEGARLASLVIPTRDRPDLLSACLASLPPTDAIEIVVVDNGGVTEAGRAQLVRAARDPRLRVLRDESSFNFSHLCNAGAAQARGAALIFLNDDVEAASQGWIEAMCGFALRPDVGAVGAKLLYPDGRLQHGGVVLGMGGRAGHAQRFLAGDAPGLFGRLDVAHEVSAVTAACLAVEARKFHAVGGFDAERLPVDLNDVDLCLRLSERGWRSVMEPRARLIHHESASRGAHVPGETRYRAEIAWFRARWGHALGDDPYFHPALSLASTEPALG